MGSKYYLETKKHLKADTNREGYFLLNEPHLLYLSNEQANKYLEIMEQDDYASKFHGPTVEIIVSNIDQIFWDLDRGVSLIDLGPGYPDKSLPMVKYLKTQCVPCKYIPVDISEEFLKIAAEIIDQYVEKVYPIHNRFETCKNRIPSEVYQYTTYCMIGLTFMNFPPEMILSLLKKLGKEKGRILIASELITRTNTPDRIIKSYQSNEAQEIGFGPLKNLGFQSQEFSYKLEYTNGRIEFQYVLEKEPNVGFYDLEIGNTIVTAVSYRYTISELSDLMQQYFKSVKIFTSDKKDTAVAFGFE